MKYSRLIGMLFVTALAVALISCTGDQSPAGPSQDSPDFGAISNLQKKLLKCTPTGYAYSAATIGPAGGKIKVGKHMLEIPRGALTRNVVITMEMGRDTTNSVQLRPEGLLFARPATLTLDYSNCSGLGVLLPKSIAYTTNLFQILQILPSIDDKLGKKVRAPLQHFSRYAVAY